MNFTFCLDLFKPVVLPWSGFPGGSAVKNPLTNAGHVRLIPGFGEIPLKRKWQPTPVFLPGEPGGQRSLVGYSPWGLKESDITEQLSQHNLHLKSLVHWW